ncbi:Glyoxalase/Bleomycin resistance protein/Dihydroxybiphenyl dioxygenase [Dissoconium aciculare CBS 342.82]|uniref:Glyoxalase/Bleomycin resistance protein/Dihydroxybiphenyl dioxygenase n=1 Tax=Dissoconium aciculare CBS 342.82 TaxID=1314786 RepID=A0A6J3LSL9_9PEZI|nr:Glyoxalase/Bleomycin resistance protein/Dihydroxybiphenyl dioxygenase [Dissoconium aciculare CBS 342.82]KAF1818776.1 Glyoxalase/Bleomycin resistance protein/Dihydroxybiphenyl dioxygenase [Dissoconium aciculare CBS 342.82]
MADDSQTKVLSPIRLAHVVLRTTDIKRLVEYYTEFLGATVVYKNQFIAFLTYDEEHHRIAIIQRPGTGEKVPNTAGLEHIAFTYDTLDDLALTYEQRKAKGMLPVRCLNHGPTTSLYYADPDLNEIEVQVDNFETADEATQYMFSNAFNINPIGVPFDPEEFVKRVRSGESHASIKKRIDA